jgi:anti-sigma factor RsiW
MDCESCRELLPWSLNGSLEEPERSEVTAHLKACPGCRAEWAETRGAAMLFDSHPPVGEILAWVAGEATALDPGQIARHVAACSRCAEEATLAGESRRALDLPEGAREGRPRGAVVAFPERRSPPGRRSPWLPAAVAAGLAAVIGGVGWFASWQQADRLATQLSQAGPAASPAGRSGADPGLLSLEVPLLAVVVRDAGSSAEQAPRFEILPRHDLVSLLLPLSEPPPAGRGLEVRLIDPSGAVRLRTTKVDYDPDTGTLAAYLPAAAVPSGRFTVAVLGVGEERPAAGFAVEFSRAAGAG